MAFWRRPMVIIVCRPTTWLHCRRWLFRRSACWICIASEKFIDRGVAGHDVTKVLGAVKGSPAGAVRKARDEGHADTGQGPAGGEEREDANAGALVNVFTTGGRGLGSNLFWTSTNWLTSQLDRTWLRQRPVWLPVSSEAIAQTCLPNNGIAAYRYHVNRGDISMISSLGILKVCNTILIF